jgi:DNA repair photolyase
MIPGLNTQEIPALLAAAGGAGAQMAHYQLVRLAGQVAPIFEDWLQKTFPDRADKVMNQIRDTHGGKLNESQAFKRHHGQGDIAANVHQTFQLFRKKYLPNANPPPWNLEAFAPPQGKQASLF